MTNTNVIDLNVISESLSSGNIAQPARSELTLRELEIHYLQELMNKYGNNREQVAVIAGISVRSLYRKLAREQEA